MENMIQQLSEIEEKANQIIERANEQKAKLHKEFETNATQMERKIASDNADKLRALQEKTRKELVKEKDEMIVSGENRLKNLEEINRKEHETLVQQVFENIIRF